ncbi:MAG: DUF1801 domain-containing protein [Dehalococcoidia bacterium]|nr:DUF1801 domain-containing protein [Dehalococcoidia bacterium]
MEPSERITEYIAGLEDWRGPTLARLRELILEAAPELSEEWKWSSPVWSHKGLVCSASGFKGHVGANFVKGASLEDRHGLFNSGLDAKATRSIKLLEGEQLDEPAFRDLVREAVTFNEAGVEAKS